MDSKTIILDEMILPSGASVLDRYRKGQARIQTLVDSYERSDIYFANARLGVFFVALAYGWAVWRGWPWWGMALPVALFAALALAHGIQHGRLRACKQVLEVFDEAVARLEGRWAGNGRQGTGLAPPHHPCAEDVDLFGEGSLFELLCTCRTRMGEEQLAAWLLHGAPGKQANERAAAVKELADAHGTRLAMAATGRPQRVEASRAKFADWANRADLFQGSGWRLWCLANSVLLLVGIVVASVLNLYSPLVALFAVNLVLLGRLKNKVGALEAWAEASERQWKLLSEAISVVELQHPKTQHLAKLHATICQPMRASKAFKKLDGLVWLLQMPLNQFFMPIAVLTLWPVIFGMAVERWRHRFGPYFDGWLDALGEFEALCALAAFTFENPAYVYPEWSEEAVFEAEGLAHPLLPAASRIANDVYLGDRLRLLVVSGSNMSGKSTLLRSVGINAVLAMSGAPVCAKRLRMGRLAIGATMRVHDSIQEGASRFYAEVLRLKQLLDLASGERKLLFLCDEILHGTNSHDRAEGARAVMKAFQTAGAIGAVTTHDLALTAMADELEHAVNVHLQDEFDGEKIVFDYRLRPGVVGKSNALALMRGAGLPV